VFCCARGPFSGVGFRVVLAFCLWPCKVLQRSATHCNALRRIQCFVVQKVLFSGAGFKFVSGFCLWRCNALQRAASYCNDKVDETLLPRALHYRMARTHIIACPCNV